MIMDDCELIEKIYGNDIIDKAKSILEDTHALLIIGPPGTGKTTLARCLAHKLQSELVEVTVHGWFSRMDLIGGYVLRGGNTVWQDGIVLRAAKSGKRTLILLDEVNRGEPERFLAELFTALSKPDKKLSVPNIDVPEDENSIIMTFYGNPFSIIWSFTKWKNERGEYIWGLEKGKKNINILKIMKEYKDMGRKVFAGIFFYGRTYLDEKKKRALALFGEVVDIDVEGNTQLAKAYMLNERFYLITKIRPLAYLKVLDESDRVLVLVTENESESKNKSESKKDLKKFSDCSDEELSRYISDQRYGIRLNVSGEKDRLNNVPSLKGRVDAIIPLNYAIGRWSERIDVSRFLKELESTGLYAITEEGKKYLNASPSISYPLDNIYIVATANTADVGVLGGLGFALQRRFKTLRLEKKIDAEMAGKLLDVFGNEFKDLNDDRKRQLVDEMVEIWQSLEKCLEKANVEDYTNYMPGWAYFIDYAKLRKNGFDPDAAFEMVFNIYIERFGCRRQS